MTGYSKKVPWKIPQEPIFKVKDLEIKINGYVVASSGVEPGMTRADLFAALKPWLKLSAYTWASLQNASEEKVSNEDLAFVLHFVKNFDSYYSEKGNLYLIATKGSAFYWETIEFIIQGYSPADAQKKALQSIAAEKFESKEPQLVEINQLSNDLKDKIKAFQNNQGGQQTGNDQGKDEGPADSEPAPTKNYLTPLIVIGLLIFLITRK